MSDNIKVAIKVRPLIARERDDNLPIQWKVEGNSLKPIHEVVTEPYIFDHVFNSTSHNEEVYTAVVKPITNAAVNGFNGTIFAYGQTSSGKTHTMMGSRNEPGVIELAVTDIFQYIQQQVDRDFLVRASYIEIYNEKIYDLLDESKRTSKIKVTEDVYGYVGLNAKEEITNTPTNLLDIMRKGNKNRQTGETNMNEHSSRSHTIFRIIIESRLSGEPDGAVQVAHLNLVDLAGSERVAQTGATGNRFREGNFINLSLFTLSCVIKQLSEQTDPKAHINFRNSKLTRILQSSLGGNAKTVIICAITPAAYEESVSTLQFAARAKSVKNKPKMNEVISNDVLLKRYAKQISFLKDQLEKERTTKENIQSEENQKLQERIALLEQFMLRPATLPSGVQNAAVRMKDFGNRRQTWGGLGKFNGSALNIFKTPQNPVEHLKPELLCPTPVNAALKHFKRAYRNSRSDLNNSFVPGEGVDFDIDNSLLIRDDEDIHNESIPMANFEIGLIKQMKDKASEMDQRKLKEEVLMLKRQIKLLDQEKREIVEFHNHERCAMESSIEMLEKENSSLKLENKQLNETIISTTNLLEEVKSSPSCQNISNNQEHFTTIAINKNVSEQQKIKEFLKNKDSEYYIGLLISEMPTTLDVLDINAKALTSILAVNCQLGNKVKELKAKSKRKMTLDPVRENVEDVSMVGDLDEMNSIIVNVVANVQKLELEIYDLQCQKQKAEKDLNNQRTYYTNTINNLNETIENLNKKQAILETERTQNITEWEELFSKTRQAEREIVILKGQNASLQLDRDSKPDLKQITKELEQKINDLEINKFKLESENEKLEQENTNLISNLKIDFDHKFKQLQKFPIQIEQKLQEKEITIDKLEQITFILKTHLEQNSQYLEEQMKEKETIIEKLEQNLSNLRIELQNSNAKLQIEAKKAEELEEKVDELENNKLELEQMCSDIRLELEQRYRQMDDMEIKHKSLEQKNKQLELEIQQNQKLELTISQLKTQLKTTNSTLESKVKRLDELEQNIQLNKTTNLEHCNNKLLNLQKDKQIQELEVQIENLKLQLEQEKAASLNKCKELEEQIINLKIKLEQINQLEITNFKLQTKLQEVGELCQLNADLNLKLEQKVEQINQLEATNFTLQTKLQEVGELSQLNSDLNLQLEQKVEQINQLEATNFKLQTKLQEFEELDELNADLKRQLEQNVKQIDANNLKLQTKLREFEELDQLNTHLKLQLEQKVNQIKLLEANNLKLQEVENLAHLNTDLNVQLEQKIEQINQFEANTLKLQSQLQEFEELDQISTGLNVQLQQKIQKLEQEIARIQTLDPMSFNKIEELERAVLDVELALEQKVSRIEELETTNSELEINLTQMNELENKNFNLNDKLEILTLENKELNTELKRKLDYIVQLEQELEQIKSEFTKKPTKFKTSKVSTKLEHNLSNGKEMDLELEEQNIQLENKVRQLELQNYELKKQFETEVTELKLIIEAKQTRIQERITELDKTSSELESFRDQTEISKLSNQSLELEMRDKLDSKDSANSTNFLHTDFNSLETKGFRTPKIPTEVEELDENVRLQNKCEERLVTKLKISEFESEISKLRQSNENLLLELKTFESETSIIRTKLEKNIDVLSLKTEELENEILQLRKVNENLKLDLVDLQSKLKSESSKSELLSKQVKSEQNKIEVIETQNNEKVSKLEDLIHQLECDKLKLENSKKMLELESLNLNHENQMKNETCKLTTQESLELEISQLRKANENSILEIISLQSKLTSETSKSELLSTEIKTNQKNTELNEVRNSAKISKLETSIQQLECENLKFKNLNENLQLELQNLDSKIQKLESLKLDLETEILKLTTSNKDLQLEVQNLNLEIVELRQKLAETEELKKRKAHELEALKLKYDQKRGKEILNEQMILDSEKERLELKLKEKDAKLDIKMESLIDKVIQEYQEKYDKMTAKEVEMNSTISNLESKIKDLETDRRKIEENGLELSDLQKSVETQIENVRKVCACGERNLTALTSLEVQLEPLKQELQHQKQICNDKEAELKSAKQKWNDEKQNLNHEIKEQTKNIKKLQTQLQKEQNKSLTSFKEYRCKLIVLEREKTMLSHKNHQLESELQLQKEVVPKYELQLQHEKDLRTKLEDQLKRLQHEFNPNSELQLQQENKLRINLEQQLEKVQSQQQQQEQNFRTNLEQQLEKLQSELQQEQKFRTDLEQQLEKLQPQLQREKECNPKLELQLQQENKLRTNLEQQLEKVQSQLQQEQKFRTDLEHQLEKLKSQLQHQHEKEYIPKLEAQLKKEMNLRTNLENQLEKLQSQLQREKECNPKLELQLQQESKLRTNLENQLEKQQSQLQKDKNLRTNLEQKIEKLQSQLQHEKELNLKLESQLQQEMNLRTNLQQQLEKLQSELQYAKEFRTNLECKLGKQETELQLKLEQKQSEVSPGALARLKNLVADQNEKLSAQRKEIAKLRSDFKKKCVDIALVKAESAKALNDAKLEKEGEVSELRKLRQDYANCRSEFEGMKTQIGGLVAETQRLEHVNSELSFLLKQANSKISQHTAASESNSKLEEDVKTLKIQVQREQQESSYIREVNSKNLLKIHELEEIIKKLRPPPEEPPNDSLRSNRRLSSSKRNQIFDQARQLDEVEPEPVAGLPEEVQCNCPTCPYTNLAQLSSGSGIVKLYHKEQEVAALRKKFSDLEAKMKVYRNIIHTYKKRTTELENYLHLEPMGPVPSKPDTS